MDILKRALYSGTRARLAQAELCFLNLAAHPATVSCELIRSQTVCRPVEWSMPTFMTNTNSEAENKVVLKLLALRANASTLL